MGASFTLSSSKGRTPLSLDKLGMKNASSFLSKGRTFLARNDMMGVSTLAPTTS